MRQLSNRLLRRGSFSSNHVHYLVVAVGECLVTKCHGNRLQGNSSSLNVVEVSKNDREKAESGNHDVEKATNFCESVGRNYTDYKVEDPVAGRCQSHSFATSSEWEDLCW